MMQFRPKTNSGRRLRKTGLWIAVLFPIVVVVFALLFFLPGITIWAAKSLWNSVDNSISAADFLRSKTSLIQENKTLHDQLAKTQALLANQEALQLQNLQLKEMLGATSTPRSGAVLGRVLAKPPVSPYDSIIIGVGSGQGVGVGDQIVAGGTIIGSIVAVQKNQSTAQLYSSPGLQFRAEIGTSHISINAIGQGGGNFAAKVPKGTPIQTGDVALLPGVDSEIFGTVRRVDGRDGDPFMQVFFTMPVNIFELTWVQVKISAR